MDSEANFQRFSILNLCNVSKKAKNDRFCCSSAVLSKVKLQNVFRKFHCCSSPCCNSFLGRENSIPIGNYMFKVNNRNTRTSCEMCLKFIIKTPERRQWCRSGVFIINFKHILPLILVFLLLTLNR